MHSLETYNRVLTSLLKLLYRSESELKQKQLEFSRRVITLALEKLDNRIPNQPKVKLKRDLTIIKDDKERLALLQNALKQYFTLTEILDTIISSYLELFHDIARIIRLNSNEKVSLKIDTIMKILEEGDSQN